MSDELRYGIIGTGLMGVEHIRTLTGLPGARVTAVADPDDASLARGARLAGPEAFAGSDYRELLARPDVDVVVIASPNYTHRAVLEDVFETGLHVLVEKPLCTTLADCLWVRDAAARHPGLVGVGMEYRYMRPVARLLEEVAAGAIGQLRMIAIREHRFPFLPKVGDWNRFARNTGGTLVEKCCHFFDLMNLVTGQRPIRVYASGAQDVNHLDESYDGERPDILDNAYTVVDFDGGARGLLDLCMFAEHSTHEVELAATGDRGKAEAFLPAHELVLTRRDRNEPARIRFDRGGGAGHTGLHHGSTWFAHAALAVAIRSGGPPPVTVEEGLWAVAVGAAAERSAHEHRPVELAELGLAAG
jgi:myo-inositol 2-dehydrogenase/D-chiro-inositol 1-dehydrogenase